MGREEYEEDGVEKRAISMKEQRSQRKISRKSQTESIVNKPQYSLAVEYLQSHLYVYCLQRQDHVESNLQMH